VIYKNLAVEKNHNNIAIYLHVNMLHDYNRLIIIRLRTIRRRLLSKKSGTEFSHRCVHINTSVTMKLFINSQSKFETVLEMQYSI